MNEIYGIDPEAPKDLGELRALLERFGPCNGRFIGRYPDDWYDLLGIKFSDLSGLDRSRFNRLLHLHRDSLLRTTVQYRRTKTWRENIKDSRQFHKVLVAEPNDGVFSTLEEFLWDDSEIDSSRGDHIPATIEAYCVACAPLFSISSEVHMADRFFRLRRESGDLDRQKFSLIRGVLEKAKSVGRCQTLVVHFEQPAYISEKRCEEQIERDLGLIQSETDIELTYDIHKSLTHGRYIFSIKGGLQFDHGFLLDRYKVNHVHWLSTGELRPIHKLFGISS